MINEKQDIAFILSFLPTVDFIKERGKDCDVLSVTNNFEVAGQSLAKLEVTQHNLHLLLPSKVSRMAVMLVEDEDISMVDAMIRLYSSKVYTRIGGRIYKGMESQSCSPL